MSNKRKRAKFKDRLTPCECCQYPISQRHHLVLFAMAGEGPTKQLCANCHELYHIIYDAIIHRHRSQLAMVGHIAVDDALWKQYKFLRPLVLEAQELISWANTTEEQIDGDAEAVCERIENGESLEQIGRGYTHQAFGVTWHFPANRLKEWLFRTSANLSRDRESIDIDSQLQIGRPAS